MAEGRVIKKYISTSERVNNLPYEAMLIYTWCIPHSDDLGLIPASPRKLRAMVGPMWDMTVEQFGIHLESIRRAGLFQLVTIEDQQLYYITGHMKEQKNIKKADRKPSSIAISLSNWNEWNTYGERLESGWNTDGGTNEAKLNKKKLNEVKGKESEERETIPASPAVLDEAELREAEAAQRKLDEIRKGVIK